MIHFAWLRWLTCLTVFPREAFRLRASSSETGSFRAFAPFLTFLGGISIFFLLNCRIPCIS